MREQSDHIQFLEQQLAEMNQQNEEGKDAAQILR